jgi:hypothetical protein
MPAALGQGQNTYKLIELVGLIELASKSIVILTTETQRLIDSNLFLTTL